VDDGNPWFATIGWSTAKAAEDCTHSRTLARDRRIASAGNVARLRMACGLPVGDSGPMAANERFVGAKKSLKKAVGFSDGAAEISCKPLMSEENPASKQPNMFPAKYQPVFPFSRGNLARVIGSLLAAVRLLAEAQGAEVAAPLPFGAVPTARQLAWQHDELIGFCHFTVDTFTGREWGLGSEAEAVFNPTNFDAEQIVKAVASGGIKELILTCKHHDGFCLWPSALRWQAIPQQVADSLASEGEPVELAWLTNLQPLHLVSSLFKVAARLS